MKFRQMTALGCMVLACLLRAAGAEAGEVKFQTTSGEMIRELTRPAVRYRSFAAPRTRTIVVATAVDDRMTKQTITVAEDRDTPKLNLRVAFDVDSASVRPGSYGLLREVGTALQSEQLRDKPILINGHTDADGTEPYNLKLSYLRAAAVKSFLVSALGVEGDRLTIRGFGESFPLVPNTSPANKQINRRVAFEIGR